MYSLKYIDRILFTINEPWQASYTIHHSEEFIKLHRQLETVFRDMFVNYVQSDNEDDFDIRVNLLTVA